MADESLCLTYAQVSERVALSRNQIYLLLRAGNFPQPVYHAPNSPRFDRAEVDAWYEKRKEQRGTKAYRQHVKRCSARGQRIVAGRYAEDGS